MPLPWTEVNAEDSQSVARLLELPRARFAERRKWGCPFCGSSDALHAYPGIRGGFGCWAACGADLPRGCRGYSNIDVALQLWGTPLPETCRRLADLLGIVYEDGPGPGRPELRPRRFPPPPGEADGSGQERNLAAVRAIPGARLPAEVYGDLLSLVTLTARGASYLRDERRLDARAAAAYGYRSVDTARQWGEIARFLAVSYREEELVAAGFPPDGASVTLPFGGRFPVLVIPFVRAGEVIGLRFRSLLPDRREYKHNRYRSLKQAKPWWPYNADALAADVVHLVEGEFNAETLRQHGHPAIGTYSAGIWLRHWTPALAGASRLPAWFDATDPNGAGDRGAEALRNALTEAFGRDWVLARWRRVRTPADANELHRRGTLSDLLHQRPWLSPPREAEPTCAGDRQPCGPAFSDARPAGAAHPPPRDPPTSPPH